MKTLSNFFIYLIIFCLSSLVAMIPIGWVLNNYGLSNLAWTITWCLIAALIVSLFVGGTLAAIEEMNR